MISEAIREKIETKLNDNTYNKKFILGSYFSDDNERDFVYNVRSGYELIEKTFISALMQISIEYQPIPNVLNGYATIPITFLVSGESEEIFKEELNATEELVAKLVGNSETIVDGSKTYNSVWNVDGLTTGGRTRPMNGTIYTQITTNVYVDFSDTYFFGNRYEYFIGIDGESTVDYTQILIPGGSQDRNNSENYPHKLNDDESKGGIEESQWSLTLTTNVNTFIEDEFIKDNLQLPNLSKTYYWKENINSVLNKSFKIFINSISKPFILGDNQMITLSFLKSDIE
ncbi:MAG TPA: hypothetical protein VJ878_00440 [Candidatus Izemoplasmatales bacterium]|nr:hypothetical protein [Candidatus Izemoplasmatales bacterium]